MRTQQHNLLRNSVVTVLPHSRIIAHYNLRATDNYLSGPLYLKAPGTRWTLLWFHIRTNKTWSEINTFNILENPWQRALH
jgi:hypothetical protein